jgi:PDZ domain-containing protein
VLVPATALALTLYWVDLPLFAVGPGPARDAAPLIHVRGTRTFPTSGRLLLTTVLVGRVNAYEALAAWLDDTEEVLPERSIIPPGQTEEEFEQVTLSQMDESKIAAAVVVLQRLTDYPTERGRGILVQDVLAGAPADGLLFPGDLILRAGGRAVGSPDQVARAVQRSDGQKVAFVVEAAGERRHVRIRPVTVPGQPDPIVGVVLVANFPFDISIRSGAIGGPSAGMVWALGLYDLLSPDDLFAGRSIAGTGAIGLDGKIQPIGGIEQKIIAAELAGADIFLAPRRNLKAARSAAEDMVVIGVGNFERAVRYLERTS